MNEELIKQIAREWAAQQCERMARRMRAREAEADELTAADRYRRGENDALLSREFELLRLYHARAFAPLVEAVEALGAMPEGFCFCSQERVGDDSKEHEVECADVRKALAPFQQENADVSD